MSRRFKGVCCVASLMLISACSTTDTSQQAHGTAAQDATKIQFDRAVHFTTPDGNDVVVGPGAYRVEQATGSQIRLVPAGDAPPILLGAQAVTSDAEIPVPIAMAVPFESDAYDLYLLLPRGPALGAHGSVSGVQSRMAPIGDPPSPAEPKLPDLVPSVIKYVAETCFFVYCEYHRLDFSISNRGTAISGNTSARLENRAGEEWKDAQGTAGHFSLGPLAPGEVRVYHRYVLEGNPDPARLVVDKYNRVPESNEVNNVGRCDAWCYVP